ncbi:hypothetical protein HaLaN_23770, partial [Haematococcus lacustris]
IGPQQAGDVAAEAGAWLAEAA